MRAVLAHLSVDGKSREFTELSGILDNQGRTMTQLRLRTQVGPVHQVPEIALASIPEGLDRGLALTPRSRA